jgi:CRP-like cAMP-binding protein
MQPLRRVDVPEQPPPGIARRETTGNPRCRSTVALLEDYVGDHRGAELTRNFAGMRKDNHDVPALAHGLRGSVHATRQNRLLALLEPEARAALLPHLEFVTLPQHRVICESGGVLEHVYFPTSGIVSLLYELANGTSVEVAMAGNDGLVGVHLLMGGTTTTTRAVVRNTGCGYRIGSDALKAKFEGCPALRQPLLRYAQALNAQTTQTAVCQCHHRLEQQFVRLVLSTLDRLCSDELALTHDAMAHLLGVRRESITEVAGKLQAADLIQNHRGRIAVLSRRGLNALVCECYWVVRAELDRLFPQPGTAVHRAASIAHGLPDITALAAGDPCASSQKHADPRLTLRRGNG